jgi:hypothetical protein
VSEIEITYREHSRSPRLIMAVMSAKDLTAERIAELKRLVSLLVRQMEEEKI